MEDLERGAFVQDNRVFSDVGEAEKRIQKAGGRKPGGIPEMKVGLRFYRDPLRNQCRQHKVTSQSRENEEGKNREVRRDDLEAKGQAMDRDEEKKAEQRHDQASHEEERRLK